MGHPQTDYERAEEENKKDDKRIKVLSYGGKEGGFSLRGATQEELDNLRGMVENRFWVTVNEDGRLEKVNKFSDVPGPADDETMMPFWSPAIPGQVQDLLPLETLPEGWFIPGLQIQGLGAGAPYSRDAYARQVEVAESLGFQCLRSRRDDESGQFWEIWYLPSFHFAKGRLKEVLHDHKDDNIQKQLELSIRFLCRNLHFGSLDVKWQAAALTYD